MKLRQNNLNDWETERERWKIRAKCEPPLQRNWEYEPSVRKCFVLTLVLFFSLLIFIMEHRLMDKIEIGIKFIILSVLLCIVLHIQLSRHNFMMINVVFIHLHTILFYFFSLSTWIFSSTKQCTYWCIKLNLFTNKLDYFIK